MSTHRRAPARLPDWGFWLSLPLLLPQGLAVRRRALRLPPAAGAGTGQATVGAMAERPPLRLLLVGDSIIAGIGVAQLEDALPGQLARALAARLGRPVQWQAHGRTGLDAASVRSRLLQLPSQPAHDLAVFSVGVNDVTGLTRSSRWRTQVDALHDALLQRASISVHLGLPPLERFPALPAALARSFGRRARRLDQIAAEVAAGPRRLHLPMTRLPGPAQFAADGFHPNAEGCAEWAADLASRLAAALD